MSRESGDDYLNRLIDESALHEYLTHQLGPAESITVELFGKGHSNETLFIEWGDRDLVLRRPPPGETADSAHDVLREYVVIKALQDTEVAVPPIVLSCEDQSVIGSDFYVMECVEGDVIRESEPNRFGHPGHRRDIGIELVDALAAIHTVDFEAVGLGDFGQPDGYTERQIAIWRRQLGWAAEVTVEVREIPELDEIGNWLEANSPPEHPQTLVHGDFKLDNVMFAPGTPPRIASVFDWEMSTLGDPRADLGWLLAFWHDQDAAPPAIPELQPTFMARDRYLDRRSLVERYEERAGFAFEHERFYRLLALYKLAALGEMFFRRYLEGNSDDPLYPLMEYRVQAIAERGRMLINGDTIQ